MNETNEVEEQDDEAREYVVRYFSGHEPDYSTAQFYPQFASCAHQIIGTYCNDHGERMNALRLLRQAQDAAGRSTRS